MKREKASTAVSQASSLSRGGGYTFKATAGTVTHVRLDPHPPPRVALSIRPTRYVNWRKETGPADNPTGTVARRPQTLPVLARFLRGTLGTRPREIPADRRRVGATEEDYVRPEVTGDRSTRKNLVSNSPSRTYLEQDSHRIIIRKQRR